MRQSPIKAIYKEIYLYLCSPSVGAWECCVYKLIWYFGSVFAQEFVLNWHGVLTKHVCLTKHVFHVNLKVCPGRFVVRLVCFCDIKCGVKQKFHFHCGQNLAHYIVSNQVWCDESSVYPDLHMYTFSSAEIKRVTGCFADGRPKTRHGHAADSFSVDLENLFVCFTLFVQMSVPRDDQRHTGFYFFFFFLFFFWGDAKCGAMEGSRNVCETYAFLLPLQSFVLVPLFWCRVWEFPTVVFVGGETDPLPLFHVMKETTGHKWSCT